MVESLTLLKTPEGELHNGDEDPWAMDGTLIKSHLKFRV